MTDQRPVRACAIWHDFFGDNDPVRDLWETAPHFQVELLQWVEASNAMDRATEDFEGEDYLCDALIWQSFPTMAAVEAANVALHSEKWLVEVEIQFENPREDPPIATVQQRLQHQREWYGSEGVTRMQEFLDRKLSIRRQKVLECLQRYLAAKQGL